VLRAVPAAPSGGWANRPVACPAGADRRWPADAV